MGPSQVEAVFAATDALVAADQAALFRSGVRMALRRAGYHASFVCRPPFANIMSSGWHLHHSLVETASGAHAFMRQAPAEGSHPQEAQWCLSPVGAHHLAGLLRHAPAMALLCTPTANGYGRFRPNALAPQSVLWGRDNRGAMLRVVGEPGDPATRIENRLGEPAANPYLYIAAQVEAGLDGIENHLLPPLGSDDPYNPQAQRLPSHLRAAIEALEADAVMVRAFGANWVNWYATLKRSEATRHEQAEDKLAFERREYFSRL
jgi:glutamine synthetase